MKRARVSDETLLKSYAHSFIFSSANNRCSGIPNKEISHKLDEIYFRKEFIVISEGYPIVRVPRRNFSYSTKIILRNNDYFVFSVLSI